MNAGAIAVNGRQDKSKLNKQLNTKSIVLKFKNSNCINNRSVSVFLLFFITFQLQHRYKNLDTCKGIHTELDFMS